MSFQPSNAENFVGLTEEQALTLAHQQGLTLRVTKRDDTQYVVDKSLRSDRVNVVIEERKIVSARFG